MFKKLLGNTNELLSVRKGNPAPRHEGTDMKLDVIKLAEQADIRVLIEAEDGLPALFTSVCTPDLERFAALVAAAEREACAKVCEDIDTEYHGEDVLATWCAAAIRARGGK